MAYAVDAQGKKTSGGGGGGGGGSSFADVLSGIVNAITGIANLPEPTRQQVSDAVGSGVQGWYDDVSSGGGDDGTVGYYEAPVAQAPAPQQQSTIDWIDYSSPFVGRDMSPSYMSAPAIPQAIVSNSGVEAGDEAASKRHESALDVWEQQAAEREKRPVRHANMWDEEYDEDGAGLGWFDNQLDMMGNTPTNDAYLRYAVDKGGLSKDEAYDIAHRPTWVEQTVSKLNPFDDTYSDEQMRAYSTIDDGTSYDYMHMTSPMMSGTQYMRYRDELGMGGREDIDPYAQYNKRYEAIENGFIPFTPDGTSYERMVVDNVMSLPGKMGRDLSDMREDPRLPGTNITFGPDYEITYGDGNTISGRDFDSKSPSFIHQFSYDSEKNPRRYLSGGAKNATPYLNEWEIPDSEGNNTYHYGTISSLQELKDGTFDMSFTDGSKVNLSNDYVMSRIDPQTEKFNFPDRKRVSVSEAKGSLPKNLDSLNDVDAIMQQARETGESPYDLAEVVYLPDMVMPDGTRVPYTDVNRIWNDRSPENDSDNETDDDLRYSFAQLGPLSNKPKRLSQQEMFSYEDGRLNADLSDLANNTVDWTLGSLPISIDVGHLPWINSVSNASRGMYGIDPQNYRDGAWQLLANHVDEDGNVVFGAEDENGKVDDEVTEDLRGANVIGSTLVPLTEKIAGDVGSNPWQSRIPFLANERPTLSQFLGQRALGAVGEGVEEIVGNIPEDFTQYGARGLFANQKVGDDGKPVVDKMGREIRDYSTPLSERVANFLDPGDMANAFSGGVAVDALLGTALGNMAPSKFRDAYRRGRALRETGVNQFVDADVKPREQWRSVDDSYVRQFDDENELGDDR